jgi:hypothetical protein
MFRRARDRRDVSRVGWTIGEVYAGAGYWGRGCGDDAGRASGRIQGKLTTFQERILLACCGGTMQLRGDAPVRAVGLSKSDADSFWAMSVSDRTDFRDPVRNIINTHYASDSELWRRTLVGRLARSGLMSGDGAGNGNPIE